MTIDMDAARAIPVERAGVPRLFLYVALSVAAAIGYATVANLGMAFGFIAAICVLCLVLLHPTALVPILVLLSVFIESTLRGVSISVGGKELLNFNGVINCSLIGATAIYVIAGKIRPFRSRISKSFLLYYAAVALSLLFSVDPLLTVRSLIRITAAYCIYLVITQFLTERRQIDRVFHLLVIVSVVPIMVGLYETAVVGHFTFSRNVRMAGTFATGMSFAMYLAMILPYIFGQVFFSRGSAAWKGFMGALFLAGLVTLAFNPTRIAWGVFAVAMLGYAALSSAKKFLPAVVILLLLTVILFLPFFVQQFGSYFTTDWKTYLSNDTAWNVRSQNYQAASSLHIRVFVWRHMLRETAQKSLLVGVGSGTWFDAQDRKAMGFSLASHSDYIEVLHGAGLIGLLTYLLFRIRQVTLLARFARSHAEIDVKRTVLYPCLLIHIACLGMSLTEVWQSYSGIYWLSWITFAISEAYYNTRDADTSDLRIQAATSDTDDAEAEPMQGGEN